MSHPYSSLSRGLRYLCHILPPSVYSSCFDEENWKFISNKGDEVFLDHSFGEEYLDFISNTVDEVVQDHSFGEGTSQAAYLERVFEKSREVLYGDKYEEGSLSEKETQENSERQTERTEFFANLGSMKDFMLKMKRVLHFIITDTTTEGTSTPIKFFNLSVSEIFRLSILNAMNSRNWEKVERLIMPIAVAFPGRAAVYHAFVILVALLLSAVYQYLIGLVDRDGGKIYSSGSLEFRSIYISIVLFQGAYVWIKFRDVASESKQRPSSGLYRRHRIESGEKVYFGKFEPRFKPSGSENYISVGSYEEEDDAKNIYQILAFYYGKKDVQGELPLGDGSIYLVPRMTEEEQCIDAERKKEWVRGKAKAVFEEYQGALMESTVWGCLLDSEIEPTEDYTLNTQPPPPDASARFGGMDSSGVQAAAHPYQLGNQGDGLGPVSPSSCSPNVGPITPGMQDHMANNTLSGDVVGDASQSSMRSMPDIPAHGAGVPGEQPLEPELQRGSLQENQANNSAINVIPDDLSLVRQVKVLQRQQQLEQSRFQQQESRFQQQESRFQQQESRFQQQESRIQQLESRISELEDEVKRLRSTEHACKRSCTSLTLRHDSQN